MPRRLPRAMALCLIGSATVATVTARAEPTEGDDAVAMSLFEAAKADMEADHVTEACPKLQEVIRLEPGWIGARIWLGDCLGKSGRLASALSELTKAESLATKEGRDDDATLAGRHIEALKPRLSTLVIHVSDAVRALPRLEVRRDGDVVGPGQWEIALPVDLGEHVVEATAEGKKPWRSLVAVTADGQIASTEVPLLEPAAEPSRVTPPGGAPVPGGDRPSQGAPTWAFVTGGAGLALGAASLAFFADQQEVQSDIDEHCTDSACDTKGGFRVADANNHLWRSYGLFVGLGVASLASLGAATYGFMSAKGGAHAPPPSAWAPAPWLGPSGGGVLVEKTF